MNNGNAFNGETDVFGKCIQDIVTRKHDVDLICRVNKFPWQFIKSGHSNTSPLCPGSPGSSVHSQAMRKLPENINMDSLLTSLLQVMNSDNFNASLVSNIQIPQNGAASSIRCNDNDSNCPSRRLNPSDFIRDDDLNITRNILADIPGTSFLNSPCSANPGQPFTCNIHINAQQFYCQTCSKIMCGDCGFQIHQNHITVILTDAIKDAQLKGNQVLNEIKVGMSSLTDDLDATQHATEILEQKARQASADVMLSIRRVVSALETREKELLGSIEKARLLKVAALKSRSESLKNGISLLSCAAQKLTKAMESKTLSNNPLNLLLAKDKTSAEIYQLRQSHHTLPSLEENWISFNSLDGPILNAVANMGTIVVNNPGPIGDRRAVRGRGNSPHVFYRQSSSIPLPPVPRGRAIHLNNFPVAIRSHYEPDVMIKPLKVFGNKGDTNNLCRPWGVACDKDGYMVIADRSNNRIQVFRHDGYLIKVFGEHGAAPGQFDRPAGVTIDVRRRVVIADKDNHRIQIFTLEGLFLMCFGEKGSRCGQFNYPWDVATNCECQIVVSDTRNHRVQLFSAEGIFLRKYGYESTPNMWKHFDSPRGVAFTPEGNVVTTDFNNHRVVLIDTEFLHAKVLDGGNSEKKTLLRPQGVAIDDQGNIIVADSRNHQIQVLDSNGAAKWRFGTYGKGDMELDRPSGIALCPDGRLAVVDFGNNRVIVL